MAEEQPFEELLHLVARDPTRPIDPAAVRARATRAGYLRTITIVGSVALLLLAAVVVLALRSEPERGRVIAADSTTTSASTLPDASTTSVPPATFTLPSPTTAPPATPPPTTRPPSVVPPPSFDRPPPPSDAPSSTTAPPSSPPPQTVLVDLPTSVGDDPGGTAPIEGVVAGSLEFDGGCVWLDHDDGTRSSIRWPAGYRARFTVAADGTETVELLDADEEVVALAGDRVRGLGGPADQPLSRCRVSNTTLETGPVDTVPAGQ